MGVAGPIEKIRSGGGSVMTSAVCVMKATAGRDVDTHFFKAVAHPLTQDPVAGPTDDARAFSGPPRGDLAAAAGAAANALIAIPKIIVGAVWDQTFSLNPFQYNVKYTIRHTAALIDGWLQALVRAFAPEVSGQAPAIAGLVGDAAETLLFTCLTA